MRFVISGLEGLSDDTLTVSRFCDLYPMRVWAVWKNPVKMDRLEFDRFTDLSAEDKSLIRPFCCHTSVLKLSTAVKT